MKAILFIALLFFTASLQAQKFSSGMTKRNTVGATDEILIKAAGSTPPQFTTPVELFNSAQAQSKFLSKTTVLPLTNYISGTAGKIAVFRGDSAVIALSGGTTGQVPVVQANGTIAFGASGSSLYSIMTSSANTTGQILVNITGLSKTLNSGVNYEFEVVLSIGVSADVTGIGIGMSYNSGVGAIMSGAMFGSLTNASTKSVTIDTFNTAYSGWLTTSGQYGSIYIKGIIYTGTTSQPLTVQFLKTTSGTVTVYSLSYLRVTLIP